MPDMVSEISHILALAERLAAALDRSPRTVLRWWSGDGRMYDRLSTGSDITGRRAARIIQRASDMWPSDLPWPSDVPRPDPAPAPPASLKRRTPNGGRSGRREPPTSGGAGATDPASRLRAEYLAAGRLPGPGATEAWYSAHWPADLPWPSDIPRPAVEAPRLRSGPLEEQLRRLDRYWRSLSALDLPEPPPDADVEWYARRWPNPESWPLDIPRPKGGAAIGEAV